MSEETIEALQQFLVGLHAYLDMGIKQPLRAKMAELSKQLDKERQHNGNKKQQDSSRP